MQTTLDQIDIFAQNQNKNVLDKFKSWSNESIRSEVQSNSIPAAVAMFHINGDFNISTLLRNTNFFNFSECIYVGKRQWDRRGAVGTQNYTKLSYCGDESYFWSYIKDKGYTPIAIENNVNFPIINLYDFEFPEKPLFIFGEEGNGLSEDTLKQCASIVKIPDFGSVRSLNVGTASGIIMNEYRRTLYKNL